MSTDRIEVNERTSLRVMMTFKDTAGLLLGASDITTLTLRLIESKSLAVINSRNGVNVKNANGGTLFNALQAGVDQKGRSVLYNFRMDFEPEDAALLTPPPVWRSAETHRAIFTATWGAGEQLVHEVLIHVKSLPTSA